MLYPLFSWMCGNQATFDLPQEIVTLPKVESEQKLGLERRKQLLRGFHSAKLGAASYETSKSLQCLMQHNAYMDFMAICHKELKASGELGSFILALKYLLSDQSAISDKTAKISTLFLMLLTVEKKQALDFYKQNQGALNIPAITSAVELVIAVDQTRQHLALLTSQLSTEEHRFTLAALFLSFIEDVEKFAAAILWLSESLSPEDIIQTHLLQKFMVYHAAFLHSEDSEIKQLYQLLGKFSETKRLVEIAASVPCEELGLGFSAYSVKGEPLVPGELLSVQRQLKLTPTQANFDALYNVFNISFLNLALEVYAEYPSEAWQRILYDSLNLNIKHLPAFINFIAMKVPTRLETLVSLISEATLENLLQQRNGAVWHFLPFRPTLLQRLTNSNIASYLEELRSQEISNFELLAQFMALFGVLCGANKAAAVQVYEAILDIALEHAELLEDDVLIKLLKRFSAKDMIIEARSQTLQARFDLYLAELTSGPLNVKNYHMIEDVWHSVLRQLHTLSRLVSIAHRCPRNKHEFQACIAKAYISNDPENFNLTDFLQVLDLPQEFSSGRVSSYEKLLIEILTTIDDKTLRDSIIELLETNENISQRWMHEAYGEEVVLRKAVKQDNVGLVEWLDENIHLNQDTLCAEVAFAAKAGKWKVATYLCESCALPQNSYPPILLLAAEGGQLNLVKHLCEFAITDLQKNHILQAFFNAAKNGNLAVMQFLWHLYPQAVGIKMIANALEIVSQHEHLASIEYLGNLVESPLVCKAVESALRYAVARRQILVVQHLCGLRNAPHQEKIEKALSRGNLSLIESLCALPNERALQGSRNDGIRKSVSSGDLTQYGIFNIKCSPKRRRSSADIEDSLGRASVEI